MKVWVLFIDWACYDKMDLYGIYTSKDKAEAAALELNAVERLDTYLTELEVQ